LLDAGLIAPALLHFEVANLCLKKMRRHPEQRDALAKQPGRQLREQRDKSATGSRRWDSRVA
jgi:hypothetical protein